MVTAKNREKGKEKGHKSCSILNFFCIIAFALLALIPFSFLTYKRNILWKNGAKLWEDVVRKSPEKARGHNNLGNAYSRQDRFEDAIQHYMTALRVKPDYTLAHINIGNVYYKQGRFEDAIQEYMAALKLKSNYSEAHINLGVIFLKKDMLDAALQEFQTALTLNPDVLPAQQAIELLNRESKILSAK